MQAQAQPSGIAALFQGSAAPMQNPRAQANVPAGPNPGIPPDLKQLLAQQARNEMAQAAQRYQALQQALQMGQGQGKPPTVAQQIEMQSQKDMAANVGPTAQAQDQAKKAGLQQLADAQRGQPANPPQPEEQGIAALDTPEFAAAGGGIIAFANEGEVPTSVAGDIPGFVSGDMGDYQTSKPTQEEYENWWEKVGKFLNRTGEYMSAREAEMRGGKQKPSAAARPETRDEAANAIAQARLARQAGTPVTDEAAPAAPPVTEKAPPAAARRSTALPTAAPVPDQLADLQKTLYGDVKTQLGRTADTEGKAAADRYEQTLGLKELLAEKEARIAAREAREAEAQKQRIPAWAMGAMGATQPRGAGLGSLLASWGGGAEKAAQGYSAADLAASEKIDMLRDTLTQAKLEGNKGKAEAATQGIKNLIDQQNTARTAGAHLVGTAEAAASRIQAARDAAAARIASANEGKLNRASEADQRVYATQSNQALQRATAMVAAEDKAAEASFKPITRPADDRIIEMYTKFLRASLPPALQHMAPEAYKSPEPVVVQELPKGAKVR